MNGFYSRVIEILKANGFEMQRQKGSHQSWCRKNLCVTVP
ncbi:type II toxin-antitoxin system HicA family toxin [Simplicispira psychrophila]|nr:type II toxin-antitoxin system HicA family toxin [Simplicispira psychrophila]